MHFTEKNGHFTVKIEHFIENRAKTQYKIREFVALAVGLLEDRQLPCFGVQHLYGYLNGILGQ